MCGWPSAAAVARRATRALARRRRASGSESLMPVIVPRRLSARRMRRVRVAHGVPGHLVRPPPCARGTKPVTEIEPFGLAILAIGLIGTAAVLSNRLSERLRVPAPAFFLVFAAVASDLFPHLARLSDSTVQRVVAVALAFILFDGGMHIGWRRFRGAAYAIGWLGVAGTFVTAGVMATAAHFLFGIGWRLALGRAH